MRTGKNTYRKTINTGNEIFSQGVISSTFIIKPYLIEIELHFFPKVFITIEKIGEHIP